MPRSQYFHKTFHSTFSNVRIYLGFRIFTLNKKRAKYSKKFRQKISDSNILLFDCKINSFINNIFNYSKHNVLCCKTLSNKVCKHFIMMKVIFGISERRKYLKQNIWNFNIRPKQFLCSKSLGLPENWKFLYTEN